MKGRLGLALVALGAAALYASLPRPTRPLAASAEAMPPSARGALHVHSRLSDGGGSLDEIAAAGARAGLKFVILTDHGDGTREPAPPAYHEGVLCIEAVEVSTTGGHVIALDLPPAPFPLGGDPRSVVEDIARLGGMSIAAHPDSAQPEMQWVEWSEAFDGLEWLNGDSEWRDEPRASLARAFFTYPVSRARSIGLLLDRPDATLRRWDELAGRRRVVGLIGADAHARLPLGGPDGGSRQGLGLPVPTYEDVFRALSITVSPADLSGEAAADARTILDAIRAGHVYSAVDALAGPAALSYSAIDGSGRVAMGGDEWSPKGPVTLRVETNAPADATVQLLRNGELVATAMGPRLSFVPPPQPAAYRVEVQLPASPGTPPVPWILSNPIYFRGAPTGGERPLARPAARALSTRYKGGPAPDWTIETSVRSKGAVDVVSSPSGTSALFRWALGGTVDESPYAAVVVPAGALLAGHDRLLVRARASAPMRLSVQLRVPSPEGRERWYRSIYLDSTPRDVAVYVDDLVPAATASRPRPVLDDVRDIVFAVDTVNAKPGSSGQVWFDSIVFGR